LHLGSVDPKVLILVDEATCIFAKSVANHEGDSEIFRVEAVLTDPYNKDLIFY